jgi:hypothetical protein
LTEKAIKGETLAQLKITLDDMPKELEGMYGRILERVEADGAADERRRMLKWALFTTRSLTVAEFQCAMNIGSHDFNSIAEMMMLSQIRVT